MARQKKIIKVKEPVRLRERKLANGNKSLYLDIYEKGNRKVESLGLYIVPGKDPVSRQQNDQAMEIALKVKAERILALQEFGLKKWDKIKKSSVTLVSWLQMYENDSDGLSKSSIKGRRNVKDRVVSFLDEVGNPNIGLTQVDTDFCREFIGWMKTAPNMKKTIKKATISNGNALSLQTVFTGALNKAVREGIIPRNPMLMLDPREKFKAQESQREYLTIEEVGKAIEAECKFEDVKRAFLFSCFCGLRLGDVRALTWRKIQKSTDGKTMFVRIRMQKNKKLITVPLSEEAQKWLNATEDVDEPIFKLPFESNLEKHIKYWMENAGVMKHITYHCSRHTFATMMLTLGADLYTVSKLMGHSKIETTQIYAKIIDQKRVDAVNLVDKLFSPQI